MPVTSVAFAGVRGAAMRGAGLPAGGELRGSVPGSACHLAAAAATARGDRDAGRL